MSDKRADNQTSSLLMDVVLVTRDKGTYYLYIYGGATGNLLAQHTLSRMVPQFAPGECDLFFACYDLDDVLRVCSGGQVLRYTSEAYPWVPSRGYQLTDDWWILDSDGKRLLMLPPRWQSPLRIDRVWRGQFLALLHIGPSEPIILDLDQ